MFYITPSHFILVYFYTFLSFYNFTYNNFTFDNGDMSSPKHVMVRSR